MASRKRTAHADDCVMALRKPMRFGMITEATVPHGITYHRRYKQMIDEAVFAEEMGFEFWGCSEQHLLLDLGVSATEVLLAAVARETSRMQMRHMIRLLLKGMNHPLRIAEQAATLDLISDGRCGLGTGRANLHYQLEAFEISSDETRPMWEESLDLIVKAFTQESFTHKGHYWNIKDPVFLTPKSLQYPHPPLYVAATSIPTLEAAGRKGIGAMTTDHYLGWDVAEKNARAYQAQIAKPSNPVSPAVNNCLSFLSIPAFCAETDKEARAAAGEEGLAFAKLLLDAFPEAAKRSKSYAYFADVLKYEKHVGDLDYFLENTPAMLIGSPDFFIKQIRRLQDMGYDEIILRIDGQSVSHEQIMRSIQLIGEHVIPEFNSPDSIVRRSLFVGGVP